MNAEQPQSLGERTGASTPEGGAALGAPGPSLGLGSTPEGLGSPGPRGPAETLGAPEASVEAALDAAVEATQGAAVRQPALPLVTRAESTLLGLKFFALGMALPVLGGSLLAVLNCLWSGQSPWRGLDGGQIFLAFYLSVPPFGFLGALMGFEAYRVVAGSRQPRRWPGWAWVLLAILGLPYGITFWLFIPLYLHGRLRTVFLQGERSLVVPSSFVHLGYLAAWALTVLVGMGWLVEALRAGHAARDLATPLLTCAYAVVWPCDYLLLLSLAAWRSGRILAPATSHKLQYSLGALLLVTLGVGAWISGLVLFFRD